MNIVPKGGEFVVEPAPPGSVSHPEQLPADARLMARTMEEFVRKEVLPVNDRLQSHEPGLMASLIRKAGQLGLLMGSVPEEYGGLGLPKSAIALMSEKAAVELSFAISVSIQSGMSLLPLLFFGNEHQRRRYLPLLASGELIGAFALSEANSGSDALGAQTKATLSQDRETYVLNGAKMWTTNGGFADLFTVFAQVEGKEFSAFLVGRDTPGVTVDKEEHKVGLHGSSTCRVLMQDAAVPASNLLGEVGQGHRAALYSLNVGRFNIGAISLGAAKEALRIAAQYAAERTQFGNPLIEFGLVRQKLAETAVRIFSLESMVYRTAGYLDSGNRQGGTACAIAASEEFAIECAIVKFLGSEAMDFSIDEAVQIHGGYGYSEEFPVARMFRDSRVFRIFEGTNEINRLTVFDQLSRRAVKGRLPLVGAANLAVANLESSFDAAPVARLRAAFLYTLSMCWKERGDAVRDTQEIAVALANMVAELYALESTVVRCESLASTELTAAVAAASAVRAFASAESASLCALGAIASGEALRTHIDAIRKLLTPSLVDTVDAHKRIAAAVIGRGSYPW